MTPFFILTFVWLQQDVGPTTEKHEYATMQACEAARQQKISEKMDTNQQGLRISRTIHADCRGDLR